MKGKTIFFSLLAIFQVYATQIDSQPKDSRAVSLSDATGPEIDKTEREAYQLFPDIDGFETAQIYRLPNSKYRLKYTYRDRSAVRSKSRNISADVFELTKLHVSLVDEYHRLQSTPIDDLYPEADLLYRLAHKYASQTRYEISAVLFENLESDYGDSPQAMKAREVLSNTQRFRRMKKALIWKGSMFDQSGRTDLLIFSGYYGTWLGIATPLFFEADNPAPYGLGLLVGGPLSLLITSSLTKDAEISEGKANIISLGGNLGTWQGLGWASIGDNEANNVVGISELSGLGGIALAILLTSQVDFSEGHAALTSSGLQWGAWFGLVFAAIADHEDEDLLRDMLIGSDVLILGTGIAAKGVQMSESRVRLINLGGVLGTIAGLGLDLIIQPDDASTALAVAGTGSVAGLAIGASLTKNIDQGKDFSLLNVDGIPFDFSLKSNQKELVPSIGFHFDF
jgi:hypothetical protein